MGFSSSHCIWAGWESYSMGQWASDTMCGNFPFSLSPHHRDQSVRDVQPVCLLFTRRLWKNVQQKSETTAIRTQTPGCLSALAIVDWLRASSLTILMLRVCLNSYLIPWVSFFQAPLKNVKDGTASTHAFTLFLFASTQSWLGKSVHLLAYCFWSTGQILVSVIRRYPQLLK